MEGIGSIPAGVQYIFCSRADRCPTKIQRGYDRPRRAGAPEGTTDVDGIRASYGLRSLCVVGYAVRRKRLHVYTIATGAHQDDGTHCRVLPSLHFSCVSEEDRDHVHDSTA